MTTQDTSPQPQLPKYEPKGMSKWDKIAMWSLIFIVVLFALGFVNDHIAKPTPAKATPAATAKAKAKATPKIDPNALTIHLTNIDKWYIDAYAQLHHTTEQKAAAALIQAGVKAQK